MFKVMKQVVDGAGVHRWTAAGPAQYPTEGEAEKGMRRAMLAVTKPRADSQNLPTLRKVRLPKPPTGACLQPPEADRFQPDTTAGYATAPFRVTGVASTVRYQPRQPLFMTMTCRRVTRRRLP